MALAYQAHEGQWRDGDHPLPYITHPFEVVGNLRFVGGITDEDILAAGFLHDVIEESAIELEVIISATNARVGQLVQEMTRQEPTVEQTAGLEKDEIWKLRSEMLLAEIAEMSDDCQVLKLADRLSNLRSSLVTRTGKNRERYIKQSEQILKIIPRKRNKGLWSAIEALIKDS